METILDFEFIYRFILRMKKQQYLPHRLIYKKNCLVSIFQPRHNIK